MAVVMLLADEETGEVLLSLLLLLKELVPLFSLKLLEEVLFELLGEEPVGSVLL